jgi:hypothetical protein
MGCPQLDDDNANDGSYSANNDGMMLAGSPEQHGDSALDTGLQLLARHNVNPGVHC